MADRASLATLVASSRAGVWGQDVRSAESPIAVRVVRNGDVPDDRRIRWSELPVRWVSEPELRAARVTPDDTLLVSSGYIGKSGRMNGIVEKPIVASNFVRIVRPAEGVDAGWLFWLLGWSGATKEMSRRAAGTSILNLQGDFFSDWVVPFVPPLPEQRAIATVLDAIDETIERAEAVIDAIERLRGALLHDLLACGVPGWHSEWREVPGLGTVPAAWEVVRLGEVLEALTYGTNTPLGDSGEVLVLRMSNLQDGEIDMSKVRWADLPGNEADELNLTSGDILFNRTNSRDLVGKVAIVRDVEPPTSFASYLLRLRVCTGRADPFWLAALLASSRHQSRLRRFATPGVSQANINPTSLKSLAIPLPTLKEQQMVGQLLNEIRERRLADTANLSNTQAVKDSVSEALLSGRVRIRGKA